MPPGGADNSYGSASSKLVSASERPREACAEVKKWLIVFLLFISTAAITFIVVYAIYFHPKHLSNVCMTEYCITAAGRMISSRNVSADPCEDFYEYACGNWIRDTDIPAGNAGFDPFAETDRKLRTQLKARLEEPVSSSDVDAVKKVKDYYSSCVECANCSLKHLNEMFELDGGWPVLHPGTWKDTTFNLERAMGRYLLQGVETLWSIGSIFDPNNLKYIWAVSQPSLYLGTTKSYTPPEIATYRKLVGKLVDALNITDPGEKIAAIRLMNDMIDFEIKLANISMSLDEAIYCMRNLTNKKTLKEMAEDYQSGINYLKVINHALTIGNAGFTVTENETVVVICDDYFKKLASSQIIPTTNPRTLATYIMFKTFMAVGDSIPEYATINPQAGERWSRCYESTNKALPNAFARLYADMQHMNVEHTKADKDKVRDMFSDLQQSFKNIADNDDWLSKKTRDLAKEKADAIYMDSYFPDFVLDDAKLNEEYKTVSVDRFDYTKDLLNNNVFTKVNNLKNLRRQPDRKKWNMAPLAMNAGYQQEMVSIVIGSPLLRPPFYDERVPLYLNYGAIGSILGHEITHGFDSKGRRYNKNGKLDNWWSQEDVDAFEKKTKCFIDQYDNYTVQIDSKVYHINGRQTLAENIADHGGLKEAYGAYKQQIKAQGHEEDVLPALKLNQDQLFFLSYAQIWCSKDTPKGDLDTLHTDQHCLNRFRVIGTLSNTPEFAETFNCKAGSKMIPTNRCSIW